MSIFIYSCKNEIKENSDFSMNEINRTAKELENEIIKKGNVEAYEDYRIAYLDDRQFGDFYKMSKIIADKFNYVPANYQVFSCLSEKENGYFSNDKYNLEKLSKIEKEEAINYLKLGAEKGEEQCQNRIKSYIDEKRYFTFTDTLIFNTKKK